MTRNTPHSEAPKGWGGLAWVSEASKGSLAVLASLLPADECQRMTHRLIVKRSRYRRLECHFLARELDVFDEMKPSSWRPSCLRQSYRPLRRTRWHPRRWRPSRDYRFVMEGIGEPTDSLFNYFQMDVPPLVVYTNNGNLLATDTVLTFDDNANNGVSNHLYLNTFLLNTRTTECVRVSADPASASATVTVERGWGTANAAALLNDDQWVVYNGNAGPGEISKRRNVK